MKTKTKTDKTSQLIFGLIISALLIGGGYYFYNNYYEYVKTSLYKDIRTKLFNSISDSEDSIKVLDTRYKQVEKEKNELFLILTQRDKYIHQLEIQSDSINNVLIKTDSTISKLKNGHHEDINNVNNWNTAEYQQFFTKYYTDKGN